MKSNTRNAYYSVGILSLILAALLPLAGMAQPAKPLKALILTGGCCHDYKNLVPFLTNSFGERVNIGFDIEFGVTRLDKKDFADGYDVIIYDVCYEDATPDELDNALNTIRAGKPAVMIHCAVHAFRNSPKIHEWEAGVGMRSKVHDPFGPFQTVKVDAASPILTGFPDDWHTPGDELYQTIEFPKTSHALLTAKSPRDARVHTVCWTQTFGQGRVFGTTLGHDMK